ncbi:MAG: hypothetical protein CMO00_00720 [Synechococcus sp. SAT82]|nr:hypothetical protein [Synechococcus sp. SAT82]
MRRWVWLLPLVLLQACAGTPLADQLEQSFTTLDGEPQPESGPSSSTQPDTAVPVIQAAPVDEPVETSARVSGQKDADPVVETSPPETVPPKTVPPQPVRTMPRQPLAPYRITIRLAGADPAAPAEAVTQALRSSAVDFMVERIERVVP